ncbi:MAG: ABC transporter permease [Planctomycetes bacterium]|nr:ABC transporter permease [Planctomycetota bacterium]
MSKLLYVARAEYLKSVRTKGFLLGVILMPVLMGGGLIALAIAEKAKDVGDRHFAVLDHTGSLYATIEQAADGRNTNDVFEVKDGGERKQTQPRWVPQPYDPSAEVAGNPEIVLSRQVEDGDLFGYLVIGKDIASLGPDGDKTFAWHTESPNYDDLPDWLERVVNGELRRTRFEASHVDAKLIESLSKPQPLTTMGLASVDAKTGEVNEGTAANPIEELVVPAILAFMMFMLVMMSTPVLMNNVLEEKMQKIAEVLVSSVAPFDLLLGKLIAAAGISLTLAVLYLGAGLVFAHTADLGGQASAVIAAMSPANLAWFLLFMVMALFIFGSVFSAIGAACSEIQDAQSLMTPTMVVFVLPMMFFGSVLKDPSSSLSRGLSLFPPATPIIMFLRVTVPPGVEVWELALAIVLTGLFTLGAVKAAEKIFRIGILSQGQAPTFRRLLGWLVSK